MGGKVGDALNWAGGEISQAANFVGNTVGDVVGGVGDLVGDVVESDLGKAALLAGGAYLAAPYLLGTAGATAAGAGAAAGTAGAAGAGTALGTGLTAGGTGLGLAAGGGLGLTAGSAGASTIGAGIGSSLGALGTGAGLLGAGSALSNLGTTVGTTMPAANYSLTGAAPMASVFDTLAGYGSGILDFAKANPQLAGSLLGALGGGLSAANAPTSQTATTSIDPQIKAEYLANLERAKTTAAQLAPRQYAEPGEMYTRAESQLYNLGMTPFGAADIQQFMNPYEEQVVQNTLADIERSRQMQALQDASRATQARAFGGSRYGVQSALTNEAALRESARTAGELRRAGYTQAANLGLAARPMNIAGLQTSLGLGSQRDALAQARLDAMRLTPLERLQITGGALGLQPARTGETSTTPLYSSTLGSALSGGLTGAYIGSLLQPRA
jgi:hypothetical protein